MREHLLAIVVLCLASAPASAQQKLILDGAVGPSYLARSRSHAIGHGFKPIARVGLRVTLPHGVELGGALSGLLDASEHYRVLGALAHGRIALWQRPTFSAGASLALGAGYDADILHADLKGGGAILPYGFVAVDGRWSLLGCYLLGVETGWDNLSIMRLGVLLGVFWDMPSAQAAPAER